MKFEDLENILTEELAWRKKEISDIKLCLDGNPTYQKVLMKSLVLLLYSHWEGYIKISSKYYIQYVKEKKKKNIDLSENFTALALKRALEQCIDNVNALTLSNELKLINKYNKIKDHKFECDIDINNNFDKSIINTKDNLSSNVFKSICNIIGIKTKNTFIENKYYIDSKLVNNRNIIGHGSKYSEDEIFLTIEDIENLKKIIEFYLEIFKEDILEYCEKEYYLIVNSEAKEKYDNTIDENIRLFFERNITK